MSPSKLDNFFLNLFLLAIFLFKIPSFYLLLFYRHPLLTTQSLARVLIFIIFLYKLTCYVSQEKKIIEGKEKRIIVSLIILFFSIQSVSIFPAINIYSYLLRFKDVFLGVISFFVFYFYKNKYKKIIFIFLISVVFNSIYQGLMVFFRDFYISFINNFVYQRQAELALININRERIHTDTYDEVVIPFILLLQQTKSLNRNIFYYLIFLGITFFSFISNWRTRIAMLIASFLGSIIFLKKITGKKLIFYLSSLLTTGYLVYLFLSSTVGLTFYDRFALINKEDVTPIIGRGVQVQDALEIGKSSFLGVGLGNYYDNLPMSRKRFASLNSLELTQSKIAAEYVHNILSLILAESGYLSLIIFLIILLLFIKNDLKLLKYGSLHRKAFVISFWTLFIYGFLNPPIPGTYQILFWGIRGILF